MKALTIRTALYLVFLTGAAKVNRATNSVVEATIRGFKAIGENTLLALDRKQDKAYDVYVEGARKIREGAAEEKISLQNRLNTVDARANSKLNALDRVTNI